MGWNYEADTAGNREWHEGYLVPEFADGERGAGTSGGDIPADQIAVALRDDGSYRTRPAGEVIGWRVVCGCYLRPNADSPTEWVSDQLWTRVPSRIQQDLTAFRLFAADDDVVDVSYADDVGSAARSMWRREHIDAIDAIAPIKAAVASIRTAHIALDAAVQNAREHGLSWAKIGAAAGITTQAAHERWAKAGKVSTHLNC
jgi:hypothetical protein